MTAVAELHLTLFVLLKWVKTMCMANNSDALNIEINVQREKCTFGVYLNPEEETGKLRCSLQIFLVVFIFKCKATCCLD